MIAENTGADIFRIEPVTPYPLDHSELEEIAQQDPRFCTDEIVSQNGSKYHLLAPGCLMIKFTIEQAAWYQNHFLNVLCLSKEKEGI